MKRKSIISLVLAAVMMFTLVPFGVSASGDVWDGSVASSFASGSGTENDPYIIKTAPQLAYLAEAVNSGNNFAGMYFRLDSDIILNDIEAWAANGTVVGSTEWTSIGGYIEVSDTEYAECPFSGVFDGNGHTVYGMFIAGIFDEIGLFGIISDAVVKDLTVSESVICGAYDVGGIVGYAVNSEITNCRFDASRIYVYDKNADTNIQNFGGIAGYAEGTIILDCRNDSRICGLEDVGGIVGEAASNSIIQNCTNNGDVNGYYYLGGIAGYSYETDFEDCVNNASVVGEDYYVGGITSSLDGTMINCYNGGAVTGTDCIGGIAGSLYGEGIISECYNRGTVTGISTEDVIDEATGEIIEYGYDSEYVGGIAGELYGGILNACYNEGSVSGGNSVGGIAGYGIGAYDVIIISCENTGDVYASGNDAAGIVGLLEAEAFNAYVISCRNAGEINSAMYAAGIVSYAYAGSVWDDETQQYVDATTNVYVSDCYNSGKITADTLISAGIAADCNDTVVVNCYNVGECIALNLSAEYGDYPSYAVVGYVYDDIDGTYYTTEVINCYALDTSAEVVEDTGVTALTDSEMKNEASFEGFDFEEMWSIGANSYPTLREGAAFVRGDVDGDGELTASDYLYLKRIYFGTLKLANLKAGAFYRSDVEVNDKIEAMDYILLKRAYFGTYKIAQ